MGNVPQLEIRHDHTEAIYPFISNSLPRKEIC